MPRAQPGGENRCMVGGKLGGGKVGLMMVDVNVTLLVKQPKNRTKKVVVSVCEVFVLGFFVFEMEKKRDLFQKGWVPKRMKIDKLKKK